MHPALVGQGMSDRRPWYAIGPRMQALLVFPPIFTAVGGFVAMLFFLWAFATGGMGPCGDGGGPIWWLLFTNVSPAAGAFAGAKASRAMYRVATRHLATEGY